jgi:peroxiredoxin Q/BCP
MSELETGATAPAFTLPDQDGTPVSLDDFEGQRVILYFYPADDTRAAPVRRASSTTTWPPSRPPACR